jgi:hypothetical protein
MCDHHGYISRAAAGPMQYPPHAIVICSVPGTGFGCEDQCSFVWLLPLPRPRPMVAWTRDMLGFAQQNLT